MLRIPYTDHVTNASMYDSEPDLHRSCYRLSKQDGSVSSGMHVARMGDSHDLFRADPRAGQGLEAPPRTSTQHLATDPGSRPSAAQPRTELSVATRRRSKMEAVRGYGYAPVGYGACSWWWWWKLSRPCYLWHSWQLLDYQALCSARSLFQ